MSIRPLQARLVTPTAATGCLPVLLPFLQSSLPVPGGLVGVAAVKTVGELWIIRRDFMA